MDDFNGKKRKQTIDFGVREYKQLNMKKKPNRNMSKTEEIMVFSVSDIILYQHKTD